METKADIRKRQRGVRDALPADVRERKSRAICAELLRLAENEKKGQSLFLISGAPGEREEQGSRLTALTVAVYSAMGSEVALDAFVRAAYDRGWRVCFPAMIGRTTGPDAVEQPMAFFAVSREAWERAMGAANVAPLPRSTDEGAAGGVMSEAGGSPACEVFAEAPFLAHPTRIFDADAQARAAAAGVGRVEPRDVDCMIVPMVAFDDAGTRLGYGGGNYDRYLPLLRDDALVLGVAFEEQRTDALLPRDEFDIPLARIVTA